MTITVGNFTATIDSAAVITITDKAGKRVVDHALREAVLFDMLSRLAAERANKHRAAE